MTHSNIAEKNYDLKEFLSVYTCHLVSFNHSKIIKEFLIGLLLSFSYCPVRFCVGWCLSLVVVFCVVSSRYRGSVSVL